FSFFTASNLDRALGKKTRERRSWSKVGVVIVLPVGATASALRLNPRLGQDLWDIRRISLGERVDLARHLDRHLLQIAGEIPQRKELGGLVENLPAAVRG